jgi:hypothetical protein
MSLLNYLGIGFAGAISDENKEWLKAELCTAVDHAAAEKRPYELRAGSTREGQGTLTLRIKRPARERVVTKE